MNYKGIKINCIENEKEEGFYAELNGKKFVVLELKEKDADFYDFFKAIRNRINHFISHPNHKDYKKEGLK